MEKYKINECLDKLTVKQYQRAVKALPKIIGKTVNTFWNYRKIDIDSKADIPHIVVVQLEQFFKLQPGELINEKIETISYDELTD